MGNGMGKDKQRRHNIIKRHGMHGSITVVFKKNIKTMKERREFTWLVRKLQSTRKEVTESHHVLLEKHHREKRWHTALGCGGGVGAGGGCREDEGMVRGWHTP